MESDRELLELAAKAAGIEITWENSHDYPERIELFRGLPNYYPWDPINDDGDNRRLQTKVKLGLSPCPDGIWDCFILNKILEESWLASDQNPNIAVVKAAAEIGKKLG